MDGLYKSFFRRYQLALLEIANSPEGRAIFQIPEKEPVVKITPNSYHLDMGGGEYRAVIRGYDLYASIITTGIPEQNIKGEMDTILPYIARRNGNMDPYFALPMALTSTFYSGAGDGHVYWIEGGGVSCDRWDEIMGQADGNTVNYTNATAFAMITQNNNGVVVARGHWPFDTSSLDNDVIINSATFSLFGFANYQDTDGKTVCLVESTQTDVTQLTVADYSKVIRNVKLSDTEIPLHLSNVAYNDWPLNATGLTKINKVGFTKLATIGNVDFGDSCTTGPACGHSVHTSEATGTANDPKLVVNYSVATTTSTTSSTSTTTTSTSTTRSTSTTTTVTSTSTTTTSTSTSSSTTTTSTSTSTTTTLTSTTTTVAWSVAVDEV